MHEPLLQSGMANVIIDGQWGSTGKGKLAGLILNTETVDVAVCDFMPNAGHTYVDDKGNEFIFRQMPVAAAFEDTDVVIGPHAAIDVDVLMAEIRMVEDLGIQIRNRLFIHPLATVVDQECRDIDQKATARIAGTAKGGHVSQALKAMRDVRVSLAQDNPVLKRFVQGDTRSRIILALEEGDTVLIETAQGYDLGLNHGTNYPYVTGRDCLLGRALDNAGAHPKRLGNVIGCLRTLPIRVGNTEDGTSGPCYVGQKELSWEELSTKIGKTVKEMTTVTKRVRRLFSWSWLQFDSFMADIRPDHLFLNFVNYLTPDEKTRFLEELRLKAADYSSKLSVLGTGPRNSDIEWA